MDEEGFDRNQDTESYTQSTLHHTYLRILGQKNEDFSAHRDAASLYRGHWRLETLVREDTDKVDGLAGINWWIDVTPMKTYLQQNYLFLTINK